LRGGRLADPDEAVDPRPAARPFDSLDKLHVPSGCLLGQPAGRTGDAYGGRDPAHFPRVSRAAVSKHLRVLREARLVRARERGREWHYSLDARPLAGVYREWLESFAPCWEESLERLKRQVEDGED